ncbi:dicarboxylate/amino acid:cation symporter [Moraxella nasovis]|uniref:dicarboxylate/amino acid:cation symporter n=1 Tax=Moraxella nasovis TaxID=2904121 RepID=UPI001F624904|nr:dicarboxylate/amino acid:cation symporter [Moraxella nasovis]UNU72664.1 dicarboxylate/amino acid:cation symporter [Moraxella nasovis]
MEKLWRWYANKSFMLKMTAGFALGVVAGLLLKEHSSLLTPLGTLFLNLLKMIVIPLVALSLIVAVNHSNPKDLGRIGLKIFPLYMITTAVSVVVGIALATWTNPGEGLSLPTDANVNPPDKPSFIDTILRMVPSNIFSALAAGDILAVVSVSVIVGLAILIMRHSADLKQQEMGELLYKIMEAGNEVVTKILNGILQYAPIGVFGITANTFGSQGLETVVSLGKFIGTSYAGVIILLVVVYPLIMKSFGVKVVKFYKDIKEAIFTSFVTSSSLSTLPISIKAAERAGISERVARLTLPIGATMNMNGTALRLGVAVIFAAEIVGVSLSVPELASIVIVGTVTAVGIAGVPGTGLIAMSIVFTQAGLPIEIVALTAGINVLVDMIFTCGNVTGDLVSAKIVDQTEKWQEKKLLNQLHKG